MTPIQIALFAALLIRRFIGIPITGRAVVLAPTLITIVGWAQLQGQLHGHQMSDADHTLLLASLATAVPIGVARGATMDVYHNGDSLRQRYSPATLFVWIVAVLTRLILSKLDHLVGTSLHGNTGTTLAIGITMIAESTTIVVRALTTTVH